MSGPGMSMPLEVYVHVTTKTVGGRQAPIDDRNEKSRSRLKSCEYKLTRAVDGYVTDKGSSSVPTRSSTNLK